MTVSITKLFEQDVATTSANGLMSSSDKTKLDSIASGAQVNPGNATTSAAGLMSSTDKSKLDGIASGAQVNPSAMTASELTTGTSTASRVVSPKVIADYVTSKSGGTVKNITFRNSSASNNNSGKTITVNAPSVSGYTCVACIFATSVGNIGSYNITSTSVSGYTGTGGGTLYATFAYVEN